MTNKTNTIVALTQGEIDIISGGIYPTIVIVGIIVVTEIAMFIDVKKNLIAHTEELADRTTRLYLPTIFTISGFLISASILYGSYIIALPCIAGLAIANKILKSTPKDCVE